MNKSLFGVLRLGVCALVGGVLAIAGDAKAGQTNMSAEGCGIVNNGTWSSNHPSPYLVTHNPNGGVSNPDSNVHDITCPMPRVVFGSSSTGASFYVDGTVTSSAFPTTCTIYSYSFSGVLRGSFSQSTTTIGTFDFSIPLPASAVGFNDYFHMKCSLGPLDGAVLRGYSLIES